MDAGSQISTDQLRSAQLRSDQIRSAQISSHQPTSVQLSSSELLPGHPMYMSSISDRVRGSLMLFDNNSYSYPSSYLTGAAPPNRPPSPIPWPVDPLSRGFVDPRIRSPADPLIHWPDDPLTSGFMKSWTRGPVDLGAFLSAPCPCLLYTSPSPRDY